MLSVEQIELFKAFAIIFGLAVAGYGYVKGQLKQRRAKSKKLLTFFNDKISSADIQLWSKIVQASTEASGAKTGMYITAQKKHVKLMSLFDDKATDQGATAKITQEIEFLCSQVLTDSYDLPTIALEIGQLMTVIYDWFKDENTFIENYPNFVKVMSEKEISRFPFKTLVSTD
tara:strand:- start:3945 stop:4463 length:519 start_codon:yes stop_codon:yes gene_type:complete